jgi:methyl-accepting chemotaxis protein
MLITGIAVLCSVWITHRVSGPMFNMKRVLRNWLAGSLNSRIRLRDSDDDEIQHFANGLNELVDQFAQEKAWRERLVREVVKDLADKKDAWADQVARRLEVVLSDEEPETV